MSRPDRIQGLDPIIDGVQETYAEMLCNHHNFNDWGEEDYELLEKWLRHASGEVKRLRDALSLFGTVDHDGYKVAIER